MLRNHNSFRLTLRLGALVVVDVPSKRHDIIGKDSGAGIAHNGRNVLCFSRDLSLLAERLELAANLARQVGQSRQVRLHRVELAQRLFFTATVFENSRSLFDEPATILGGRLQHRVEAPLANNDVHLATKSRIGQKFLNIEQPARFVVDCVVTLAAAEQGSRDGDLGVINGQCTVGVVNRQNHLGAAKWAARGGSGKNDVFHLPAAEGFGALLTHHPGEGVNNV